MACVDSNGVKKIAKPLDCGGGELEMGGGGGNEDGRGNGDGGRRGKWGW
jgi:hypothetical protein